LASQLVKPRVLVVDDNYGNRVALESLLEREYAVDQAGGGGLALRMAAKETYAVILLDVRMPGKDGFEIAEALRKDPKNQDTVIIFISAFDVDDAQVARGYQACGTDYLFSPIDPDFLKLKMRTYVRTFLRINALRLHIEQLTNMLQILELEVNRAKPAEEALRAQVRALEQLVAEMRREMTAAP
jgi:PleD family two-component response regulator